MDDMGQKSIDTVITHNTHMAKSLDKHYFFKYFLVICLNYYCGF